jgi:hypothetical protein
VIAKRPRRVEGAKGNPEVSPVLLLRVRRDTRAARAEAYPEEKGGRRGNLRFLRATEPKAEEGS